MRSAELLQRDITDELAWDPQVDSSDIAVTVQANNVTLAGHVSTYAEKIAAEAAARRVAGVKSVVDKLEVRLRKGDRDDDANLAITATSRLQNDVSIPGDRIIVVVRNGWIRLEGDVTSFFQKEAAEDAIRKLRGVRGVSNNIHVTPAVPVSVIKDQIAAAFRRNADIDANQLTIETDGSRVILRGNVRSWNERRAAQTAAWRAPGVTEVVNELGVDSWVATIT